MAGSFTLNSARRLVWDIEISPYVNWHRVSPVFCFQNCEWCFKLECFESGNIYGCYLYLYLGMVSKSQLAFSQPFEVTFYVENENGTTHSFQARKINSESDWRASFDLTCDMIEKGKMKMVIIFDEEVRSTLHLASENENCRNDAAGTHSSLEILSSDVSKLLDEDLHQDVELKCEDRTFKVHKCVLSARSKVFLKMLQSDMLEGRTAEVVVKDMKSDVCHLLLRYIYSGKLPELTLENASDLYEAADRYNVGGLMKPCAEFLTMNLTPDTACEMLVLADSHSDQNLKETVIEYMLDKEIPLEDDLWKSFCPKQPLLAIEVLNRFCRSQKKQKMELIESL